MQSWEIKGVCPTGETPFIKVFSLDEADKIVNNLKSLGFNPFVIIN